MASPLVVVVGAGPVGCLAAIAFAKRGWTVHVYEARSERFFTSGEISSGGRSINLAISARGITALQSVDGQLAARCLENMIPMKGRFVHALHGRSSRQNYDTTGQCINSVDRGLLNQTLLDQARKHSGITVFFDHKLTTADFDGKILVFQKVPSGTTEIPQQTISVRFDLCIGADGSYSNVRRQLMRVVRMDFQQEYIPHDYLELHIPAGQDADGQSVFSLDPNYLHIWPRHSFMLIALPNQDKSFTCTLFAPTDMLAQLSAGTSVSAWFRSNFPDVLALIGENKLITDFASNPRGSLISIKANPYHYKDRVVIVGDAAHSMVPFYGQGLNCGLEDIRILDAIMHLHSVHPLGENNGRLVDRRLENALMAYTEYRHKDLVAISELAMQNYVEMRHSVTTVSYLLQKSLDELLGKYTPHTPTAEMTDSILNGRLFPSSWARGWLPLYTMVTFRSDMAYSSVLNQHRWQSFLLKALRRSALAAILSLGLYRFWRARH